MREGNNERKWGKKREKNGKIIPIIHTDIKEIIEKLNEGKWGREKK